MEDPFNKHKIQKKKLKTIGIWEIFGCWVLGWGHTDTQLIPSKSMKVIGIGVWFHDEDPESYKILENKHDKSSKFIENLLQITRFCGCSGLIPIFSNQDSDRDSQAAVHDRPAEALCCMPAASDGFVLAVENGEKKKNISYSVLKAIIDHPQDHHKWVV